MFHDLESIEEVYLGFLFVDVKPNGKEEGIEAGFEGFGFLHRGVPHEHGVIHKLLIILWLQSRMRWKASKLLVLEFSFDNTSQSFHHEDKEEGREGVSFSDASRRLEGFGGSSIDKNGEKRGRNEGVDPFNPLFTKFEC